MTIRITPFAFADAFAASPPAALSASELAAEVARLQLALATAREEGRQEGMAQALRTLEGERDTALLAATTALSGEVAHLAHMFEQAEAALAQTAAELALDLADHLAGAALDRDPALGLQDLIGSALLQSRKDVPLTLRVAPGMMEAAQACLARHCAELGEVRLVADAGLSSGDARLAWDGGAMVLDRAQRRKTMVDELAAMLAA